MERKRNRLSFTVLSFFFVFLLPVTSFASLRESVERAALSYRESTQPHSFGRLLVALEAKDPKVLPLDAPEDWERLKHASLSDLIASSNHFLAWVERSPLLRRALETYPSVALELDYPADLSTKHRNLAKMIVLYSEFGTYLKSKEISPDSDFAFYVNKVLPLAVAESALAMQSQDSILSRMGEDYRLGITRLLLLTLMGTAFGSSQKTMIRIHSRLEEAVENKKSAARSSRRAKESTPLGPADLGIIVTVPTFSFLYLYAIYSPPVSESFVLSLAFAVALPLVISTIATLGVAMGLDTIHANGGFRASVRKFFHKMGLVQDLELTLSQMQEKANTTCDNFTILLGPGGEDLRP